MSTGKTHVIIVAVENYNDDADFPTVDFATKDATDLEAAFKTLGYEPDNITVLLNEKATRTKILHTLKKIASIAEVNDRVLFYFAGHGFYENGENLLACADAIKSNKPDSCISINSILGILKTSASHHKILFLDCCHSGFEPGEYVRDGDDTFMADELILQFSKEEYCIGFASCKTNQASVSHPTLRNGVWSHYLIKALSGEAKGIYKSGLLFSDALQAYLKDRTTEFVKLNTIAKKDQNPIKFGTETDKFIIADINPILEGKRMARKPRDVSFTRISLIRAESSKVRNLPGFQKGFHKVPSYVGTKPNDFILDISFAVIEEEISEISKELKKHFSYKRTEMKVNTSNGDGSIVTPDFDYHIQIFQSKSAPDDYIFVRRLEGIRNPSIVTDPNFNRVFSNHFDRITFELNKEIDIENLIDSIEALEDSPISVTYDDTDLSKCTVSIEGLEYDIEVEPDLLRIATGYTTRPDTLIEAFKEARKAIALSGELKMLELG